MARILEVRFEQAAQSATRDRFSVPKAVVEILGIDQTSDLLIEVVSHKGSSSKVTRLRSGFEIYRDFEGHFEPGELLTIRVARLN